MRPRSMRVLALVAVLAVPVVLAAGCARAPVRFYEACDVAPQPALAGGWCMSNGAGMVLTLVPAGPSRFRLRCSENCDPLVPGRDYTVTPFSLDGRDYLDVVLRPASEADDEPLTPHTVLRLHHVGGAGALVSLISARALQDALGRQSCAPAVVGDGDDVVILADTGTLRDLLRREGDSLFGGAELFTRCEEVSR